MAVAGMYRRSLPSPPAIDFSSPKGKKLFTEAHNNGNMEGFFKLIPHFQTQSEPAYCGLASLAMVLNALAIDPCRKWKGPWRWFDETMLDCCEPLDNVKAKGISFGKVVCLARCAGANVKALRANQSTIDEFRKYIMSCSTSDDCHVITSYDRRAFKQTGTGHFSPIGGYHAESDMVLILDVARFKYPPHWVPLSLLWDAMNTIIEGTGRHRGFMLVSRQQRPPALLYNMSCKHDSWITTGRYMTEDVPRLLSSDNIRDIKDVIYTIFSSLPSDFAEFVKWVAETHGKDDGGQPLSDEEEGRLAFKQEVFKLVQDTTLYKHLEDTLSSENYFCTREETLSQEEPSFCPFDSCGHSGLHLASNGVLTALLLALPPETWSAIKDEQVFKEVSGLVSIQSLPSSLQDEVLHMRGQLLVLKRCKDDKVEDDLHAL